MSMLRDQIIRLAQENPELRSDLVPVLRKTGKAPNKAQRKQVGERLTKMRLPRGFSYQENEVEASGKIELLLQISSVYKMDGQESDMTGKQRATYRRDKKKAEKDAEALIKKTLGADAELYRVDIWWEPKNYLAIDIAPKKA
jgi:hypothetical protein